MQALATCFASQLNPGDCYCLYGDVGAGKSVFSRAFVRAAADDPLLPVPSPTFLLQNTYDDHGHPAIHHFDLYRLSSEAELRRLDLPRSMRESVCLIEWPERLHAQLPEEHLAVHIDIVDRERGATEAQSTSQPGSRMTVESGAINDSGAAEEEEEGDAYSDRRCRKVLLVPHGSYWIDRLDALESQLQKIEIHMNQ